MKRAAIRGICSVGLLAMTLSARPAAADTPITEDARQHFNAGVAYMQDPDGARYAEAYQEFLTAYKASPSWKILGNLGISAMKLERDGEAVDAFTKYLEEGGQDIDPAEREQISRDLSTLKASLASLSVESTPAGAVLIDERIPPTGNAIVNRYGPMNGPTPVAVKAGKHRLTAQLDGYEPATFEAELLAGSRQSHAFQLQKKQAQSALGPVTAPPPADRGTNGLRIASYAAFGVGVVGLAGGTIFALSAKSKADEAQDLCGGDTSACKLDAGSADADKVTQLNEDSGSNKTLSIVGFGLGGVGIAAGITLFILSSRSSDAEKQTAAAPRVMPWVGVRSAGLVGSF